MSGQEPSLKLLDEIANGIAKLHDCVRLAIQLDLGRDEVGKVQHSSEKDPSTLAMDVLTKWTEVKGEQARVSVLRQALQSIKRADLVGRLDKIVASEAAYEASSEQKMASSSHPQAGAGPAAPVNKDEPTLLKLYSQFCSEIKDLGTCDTLAIQLEVNSIQRDFVQECREQFPELITNHSKIAEKVLFEWHKRQAEGTPTVERLRLLKKTLQDGMESRPDLLAKLCQLQQLLFPELHL